MSRADAIRKKMDEGKLVKGFFLTMADPMVNEMAGYIGYDYVWIDAEHLENIVEFELIPLLKEYWFDEPAKVKEWANNLRSAIK